MFEVFILFSGGLALLIALGQFVRRFALHNIFLGGLFALLGVVQLTAGLDYYAERPPVSGGILSLFRFPAILLLGPLLYFYILSLTVDGFILRKVHLLHLLPSLLALLYLFPVVIGGPNGIESGRSCYFGFICDSELHVLHALALLTLILYLIAIQRKLAFWSLPGRNEKKRKRIYFGFIVTALIGALGAVAILFLNFAPFLKFVNVLAAFLIVLSYLAGQRYPYLENRLELELKKRYRNSRLRNLDLIDLEKRIEELMITERVYLDEDLTLPGLAGQLGITVHQLSQYLNEQKKVNFNRFMNEHRIAEACNLLVTEPHRSTLSVGLAVGFNSNSAFYSAFKSIIGITPSAYRKKGRRSHRRFPTGIMSTNSSGRSR